MSRPASNSVPPVQVYNRHTEDFVAPFPKNNSDDSGKCLWQNLFPAIIDLYCDS